jgi:Tfp pilus assembly protein PilF
VPLDRLDGWKAIAGHLNRDIRTAQRWERTEHLPVYRLAHHKQSSAYSFRSELDEWLRRRTIPIRAIEPGTEPVRSTDRRRASIVAAAAGTCTALILVAFLRGAHTSPPPSVGHETKDALAYSAFAEGQALYNARRYEDAAAALERAVARDPSYGSGWALLAKTYGRTAQWVWAGGPAARGRATADSMRAAELLPNSADTHVALALAARARQEVPIWRTEAQRAITADPFDAEAYALLGDWFSAGIYTCGHAETNPELADDYYRKALDLKPDLTVAVENRAANLRHLGRYSQCVDLVTNSLVRLSDETPLFLMRGYCLLAQADVAAAARDIEPLRNNPKIAPLGALVAFGWLALERGDIRTGTRNLESAANAHASVQSELNVAEVYTRVGMTRQAVVHMKRAFDMNRACVGTVAHSPQFQSIRQDPELEAMMAGYSVR